MYRLLKRNFNIKKENNVTKQKEESNVTKQKEESNVTKQKEESNMTKQKEENNMTKQKEESNVTKQKEESNVTKQKEESNVLTIFCLYLIDHNKSIDVLIPNDGYEFLKYDDTKLSIYFINSENQDINNIQYKKSLFNWEKINNFKLKTDKIDINIIQDDMDDTKMNLVKNKNLFLLLNSDIYKKNDIIYEKVNKNYYIFNPLKKTHDDIRDNYHFLSTSKQNLVKIMFGDKLSKIFKNLDDFFEYGTHNREDINNNFMLFTKYLINNKDLENEFKIINTKEDLLKFSEKLNKIMLNEYNYANLIN